MDDDIFYVGNVGGISTSEEVVCRRDGYEDETVISGLQAETKYAIRYHLVSEDGTEEDSTLFFTTPQLTFKTLPAKATSNTVALICAETNISENEIGTGFEWRRYDAPDLVPSTQSECPVIDGVLMGALRNLSSNTYYKFRPYYTAASGKTYYGEWSAFGTADAYVYFDPTVRTYKASDVGESSAKVRGYVIAGSDDITEQGFEYWETEKDGTVARKRVTTDREVQTVIATGQWMTATLDGLNPQTTYAYRVYVKTSKGTTYGEEMTFDTKGDVTAVEDVSEAKEIVEIARYDLEGRRITAPRRGLNIVRYSDGSVRKVLVK